MDKILDYVQMVSIHMKFDFFPRLSCTFEYFSIVYHKAAKTAKGVKIVFSKVLSSLSPLFLTLIVCNSAFAREPVSLTKNTALPIDAETTPVTQCAAACEIVIEGIITAKQPLTLVLRVDDLKSANYADRVNDERSFAPGKFKWRRSLSSLRTTNGRILNSKAIRRIILFLAKGQGDVSIASFKLEEIEPLPVKAKGLNFGAWDAPLPRGFERVLAGDPRIQGQPFIIRRIGPDPLIAGGLRGLNKVHVDWPKGRALVSFWSEDPGEWELLPFPIERKISVNGLDFLNFHLTPPQWLKMRYLAGSDSEPIQGTTAWQAFGQHRGGLVSKEVEVGDEGINIELSGDSPAALFLSSVLVEPAGQNAALTQVLKNREQWYNEQFALGEPQLQRVANQVEVNAVGSTLKTADRPKLHLTLAPGSGARASILVHTTDIIATPKMVLATPETLIPTLKLGSPDLPLRIWAVQRQLDRADAGSNLLVIKDERLRSQLNKFPITPEQPRRYEIWVDAPFKSPAGIYSGQIKIGEFPNAVVDLDVEVLPVALPQVAKPSGFYLDEAPHLVWFPWPTDVRRRQIACDLSTLTRFGINGNAPALSTPINNLNDDFMKDAQIAAENNTVFPWMAYAPATRALQSQGLEQATRSIQEADQRMIARGYHRLIWSVADEPSNPDLAAGDLKGWILALRKGAAGVKLAAHLNSKADRILVPLFDTVMVNAGYGINADNLSDIALQKVQPWLYNTGKPRFTAGLWLWATAARHYIQWHARMPTADPFDPTDGREGDVQMFYPGMEICPVQPDMNADVLSMAEGMVDQRWLLWLSARPEPEAQKLTDEIKTRLGTQFETASKLNDADMAQIRQNIINLARILR